MSNRTCRERALAVRRRLARACRAAGLRVDHRSMTLSGDLRVVTVNAAPMDWHWPRSAIELRCVVEANGTFGPMQVFAAATREDPVQKFWDTPTLRNATLNLVEVETVLPAILEERSAVIRLMAAGRKPPFRLRWTWSIEF